MVAEVTAGYRLSPQQKRLWKLHQQGAICVAQCAITLKGSLDIERLKKATREIVSRHEILRTTFPRLAGMKQAVQVVTSEAEPGWKICKLNGATTMSEIWATEKSNHFDLEKGPLVRCTLYARSLDEHVLFVSLPSLCADNHTLKNLFHELAHSYHPGLHEEPGAIVQYLQYSEWQNELVQEPGPSEIYWLKQDFLETQPVVLPGENVATRSNAWAAESIVMRLGLAQEKLKTIAHDYEVSEAAVLLASWQTVLWRLTFETMILLSLSCHGRIYEEMNESFGLYSRWLPVIGQFHPDLQGHEVFRKAEKSIQDAHEWQEYFSAEPGSGNDQKTTEAAPLRIGFSYEDHSPPISRNGLRFSLDDLHSCTEPLKLWLSAMPGEQNSLRLEFGYNPNIYSTEGVARLAEEFEVLLTSLLSHPETRLAELPVLGKRERHQILSEWNDTQRDYAESQPLHHLFELQVDQTPAATAVVFRDESLTFEELNRRANQLASLLRSYGVGPESLVALYTDRSLEMIVGVLGAWKAGGAFVPIDCGLPPQRLALLLSDARPSVIVTQEHLLTSLPQVEQLKVVCLDSQWKVIATQDDVNHGVEVYPDNAAYVIYTSGSTGSPKGVVVQHRSAVNLLRALEDTVYKHHFAPLRVSMNAPLVFDASIKQLIQLLRGCTLYIIPEEVRRDGPELLAYRSQHSLDVLDCTPSQLRMLLAAVRTTRVPLDSALLLVGGENLDESTWKEVMEATNTGCWNLYGPTECTVDTTACFVPESPGSPTIGRPLANVKVYLLDQSLQPVPIGVAGELHIGGAGLARCYLNRPDLTASQFIPDLLSGQPGARLYKTGDRARYRPDGKLEFLDRMDFQVKVRGVRVELGEIESVLAQHPSVREAVVIARTDEPEQLKRLVAYVVPKLKYVPAEDVPHHTLPNGMTIAHLNKNETEYLYHDIFEEQAYLKHGVRLVPRACVFDVGANIGLFSMFVRQHCPDARVYAFEPLKPIYNILSLNAQLYGEHIKTFPFGLSNNENTETFTYYPHYSIMSGVSAYANAEEDKETVRSYLRYERESGDEQAGTLLSYADDLLAGRFVSETHQCELRKLSSFIRQEKIARIDLLKIDVQRAELEVLEGIEEEHWQKIMQVVMEVHDFGGAGTAGPLDQTIALLESYGFRVVTEQEELLKGTDRHQLYAMRASYLQETALTDTIQPVSPALASALSVAELRSYLKEKLPEYMLPSAFVVMERLPVNANGKIDRQSLPAPSHERPELQATFIAPSTEAEKILAGIWRRVLKVENIGVNDNFFDLGGDSILSIQVTALAAQQNLRISPRLLFQYQSIAGLARVAEPITVAAADQSEVRGAAPLTPIQHRFLSAEGRDPHRYNQAVLLSLPNSSEAGLHQRVFERLLRHHDALRMRFERCPDGSWQQYNAGILEAGPHDVEVYNLANLNPVEQDRTIAEVSEKLQSGLQLETGPLVRVAHFTLGEDRGARLLLVIHHLVIDGVSWRILLEDWQSLYQAWAAEKDAELPAKTTSFKRWSELQVARVSSGELNGEIEYWARLGTTGAARTLPVDRSGGANIEGAAQTIVEELGKAESEELLGPVCRALRAQPQELVLTATAKALCEWAGVEWIAICVEGHGREQDWAAEADATRTVGWFTSLYPVELGGGKSMVELVRQTKETLRAAPGGGLGYGILRELSEEQDVRERLKRSGQGAVLFNFLGQVDEELGGEWRLAQEAIGEGTSSGRERAWEVEVVARVRSGSIVIGWRYSSERLTKERMQQVAAAAMDALRELIRSRDSSTVEKSVSPSDFPLAGLDQAKLEKVISRIRKAEKPWS